MAYSLPLVGIAALMKVPADALRLRLHPSKQGLPKRRRSGQFQFSIKEKFEYQPVPAWRQGYQRARWKAAFSYHLLSAR